MSSTVRVGCKWPNGLRLVVVGGSEPEVIVLPGPPGHTRRNSGGRDYSVTTVDEGFWRKWLVLNQDSDLVARRIIFEL